MKKILTILLLAAATQSSMAQGTQKSNSADTVRNEQRIARDTTRAAGFLEYVASHSKVVRTIVYLFKK